LLFPSASHSIHSLIANMQTTFALLALAAAGAVSAASSAYVETLSPTASAPAGCATSYSGSFEITVVKPSTKRSVEKRSTCSASGTLIATLTDGVLTDSEGRIGGIVSNGQFQFDGPPSQAGTIYNKGWSVCGNGSLALGDSAVFYQCLSGDFYNLYDVSTGAQCSEVLVDVLPCDSAAAGTAASAATDGQVTAASAAAQVTDGQVTAGSAVTAAAQITDGQIQASSATPIAQITDGQIQASSAGALPVAQYTDGQLQVSSNIPTVTAVAQITDGQIQASSAAAVTSAVTPIAQISDGQIQASTAVPTLASVVSAGAGNKTASATGVLYTGAANSLVLGSEFLAAAAGVVAVVLL